MPGKPTICDRCRGRRSPARPHRVYSVERMILHYTCPTTAPAPTEFTRWRIPTDFGLGCNQRDDSRSARPTNIIDPEAQGGAAAPLTLGFGVQPLRGKELNGDR